MNQRRLGRDGPHVSRVGFGAWAIGGNAHGNSYGPTDDAESTRAVKRAIDLGCTFFDTADVYGWGHSEEVLGEALEGRRKDVLVATKVGGDFYHGGVRLNFEPEYLRFALRESLKRLRTDYVDLYQLHNAPANVIADPKTFETLEQFRRDGLIRNHGVSVHDPVEGIEAMDAAPIASVQVVYNLFQRAPEEELLPEAARRGVGVIAREPLWNGFLSGKYTGQETFPQGDIRSNWPRPYAMGRAMWAEAVSSLQKEGRTLAQAALAFVLRNESVSTVIPGCKTVEHVEENLGADGVRLDETEIGKVDELLRSIPHAKT